jgi:hypothetical protein
MKRPLVCKVCLERDGVETVAVVEHRCTNERTGEEFTAHVCARCLEVGRETRVTCRTFTRRSSKTAAKIKPTSPDDAKLMPESTGHEREACAGKNSQAPDLRQKDRPKAASPQPDRAGLRSRYAQHRSILISAIRHEAEPTEA